LDGIPQGGDPQPPNGDGGATGPVPLPLGRYSVKIDDKGRLKLPVVFQDFVKGLPDGQNLFVTSVDCKTVAIYPVGVWRKNLKKPHPLDAGALRAVSTVASDLGTEEKMDSQGRVTLNTELRAALGLGDKSVLHLVGVKGHIDLITDAVYQANLAEAKRKAPEASEQLYATADWD
jgi:DNA-binding transcriptional regulator/RsmH inhibitor MraZ